MYKFTDESTFTKPPFEEDKPKLIELINRGFSDLSMAQAFNVSEDTIRSRRQKWGLDTGYNTRRNHITEGVQVLWQQGYGVKEIAAALETTPSVVYNNMQKHGVRNLKRMNVDAPEMSLTDLRNRIAEQNCVPDEKIIVTYARIPKWVLVPIDEYQILVSGEVNA
jgi:hypothetical protein